MPLHPTIEAVTDRIVARSRDTRVALSRPDARAPPRTARGARI